MQERKFLRVTIVTVCRNAGDTIGDCLASLAGQQMPAGVEVEHIICDGASTDGTVETIERHIHRADLPAWLTCRFLSEPDAGLYDALNKGMLRATGDVVGILHADDFHANPQVLARVAEAFSDRTTEICYGDLLYVKTSGKELRPGRYWKAGPWRTGAFHRGWMPPHPTVFLSRNCLGAGSKFRTDLGSAADYEFLLRLFQDRGLRSVSYIPEILVCMREGGASTGSLQARLAAHRADRMAWRLNDLRPAWWTLAAKPLGKLAQWFARSPIRPDRWWRTPDDRSSAPKTDDSSKQTPLASLRPLNQLSFGLLAVALLSIPGLARAQNTVFRYSQAGPWAYAEAKDANRIPKRGIKIGNMFFESTIGLASYYNSNANISHDDPVADLYVVPTVGARLFLPLSDVNSLDINLNIGYQQGFNEKDPNRRQLLINSDSSAIDLRIFAGDFFLRVYDSPLLFSNPGDDPTLANVGEYSIFSNIVGASLTWDLYQFVATLGGEWRVQKSLTGDYNYSDQFNYVTYLTAFVPISSTFSVGGFATMYITDYPSSFLANSYSFTAGFAAEGSLTRYTTVSLQAGLQYIYFEGGSSSINNAELNGVNDVFGGTYGDDSYIGPYIQFQISNQLSKNLSHRLTLSNEAIPSYTADFAYYLSADYSIRWQVLSNLIWTVNAQIGYGENQGIYDDIFVVGGGGTQLRYEVDRHISVYLQGSMTIRESRADTLSYNQFIGGGGIEYRF